MNVHVERATVGAGCFWCIEPIFKQIRGVKEVTVGYAGGKLENPTYEAVSRGNTGHAEVARIAFDPDEVSFEELLQVFFYIHNPMSLNRQGNDIGPQYRSIILYENEEQKEIAERIKRELDASEEYDKPIVTEIVPLKNFWPAEEYHQEYYKKNPEKAYCQLVIAPKIKKFEETFARLRKQN